MHAHDHPDDEIFSLLLGFLTIANASAYQPPMSPRAHRVISNLEGQLKHELNSKGLRYGAPIFMRIFKQPGTLEIWVESENGRYQHFKDYEICRFSGSLGPKRQSGDYQSPEGFYEVSASSLNPWSQFHLSFDIKKSLCILLQFLEFSSRAYKL